MSETANRIVRNTGYLYARLGISMFISLWTTRLVLNALGSSDFGIYSVVGGTIGMLSFLNISMSASTQRFMSYAEGRGNLGNKVEIFNVSFALHTVIGFLTAIILAIAGYFFFYEYLDIPSDREFAAKVVFTSLIVSSLIKVINVPYSAILNAHENMKFYAVIGVVESFSKLLIAFVCFYYLGDRLILYGILMTVLPLITYVIMRQYCRGHYNECIIDYSKMNNFRLMKEMSSFAGWRLLESSSTLFTMNGVSILLNIYGGVIVNAAHGIANQLQGQLLAFASTMQKALNPVLVKNQGSGRGDLMLTAATTGNKLSYCLFAVLAFPMMIEAPYILSLWLGNVPEFTVLFTRLLLIRTLLWQICISYETCIAATGEIKAYSILASVIYVAPLLTCFFLYKYGVPIFTIYILLIIMMLFRMSNILYFCKQKCGLDVIGTVFKLLFPCLVVSILIILFISLPHFVLNESFFRLIIIIVSCLLLFPFISFLILFDKNEKKVILRTIKSCKYVIHDKIMYSNYS